MSKNISLTTGSVKKSLLQFTIPIALALFLQITYGAVDLLIVGQFSQVADVTGVTIGTQNFSILISVCTGLAVGTTVLVAKSIGEGNNDAVQSIIANTVIIFTVLALLIMVLMIVFNNQLVAILKTPTEAVNQTSDYLFYCTLGIPLIFAFNVLGSIFRGLGDSKTPLIAVGIACVCNIVLDLILVGVFKMGAGGAAIATSISQGISVVICLLMMRKSSLKVTSFKPNFPIIKHIFSIGTPVALQSGLTSISFLLLLVIVNQYNNVSYSSALGVTEKITGFIMLVPIAFMQSLSSYVAQNLGARKLERANKALKISIIYSFIFGLIMAMFTFIKGDFLAGIFNRDAQVIVATISYLKAYAFDAMLVPFIFSLIGYFNGVGKTKFVMIQGIIGAFMLRVPLAYMFSLLFPQSLFHIGLASPITTLIQIFACLIYLRLINNKLHKQFS